jgi:hypothetical protein
MEKYPLFCKKNIPSYIAVMTVWALISVISSFLLYQFVNESSYLLLLIWAAITSMLGMMIMFGASVVNLRKLSPGFKRLAAGEKDPKIPPVWCPVLTAATNAAIELAEVKNESK